MKFVPSTRNDIDKYYRHTFLKFKETGDLLFYLDTVGTSCISGTIEDGREFKLYLAEEEPYEVDYILPHKSFFQYGENAVMLQRNPAKQYNRGITGENTMLCYRTGDEKFGKLPLDFTILKAFVNKKKFYSLQEAIKEPKLVSVALSSRMMYVKQNKQIYMDFVPIARVSLNRRIQMIAPIFKEEVEDFLKTTQETDIFSFVELK